MYDIFVKELDTGYIFQFPMAPERIKVKCATRFLSYDIMNTGEHKIPLGEELCQFDWDGLLPGGARRGAPYVLAYENPEVIQGKFSIWRNRGMKLLLTVPGTPINHAVYLSDYQCEYAGGVGDIAYSIHFVVAKDIIVGTEDKAAGQSGGGVKTTTPAANPAPAKTYTVKSGDSLWKIAQKYLGSGSRWQEIYEMNKGTVGKNPNLIYPGQVYNLPA